MSTTEMTEPAVGGWTDAFETELRDWLRAHRPDPAPESGEERFAHARAWQAALAEGGWLGLGWPSRFGGRDMAYADEIRLYDVLAELRLPEPAGFMGLSIVGPTILQYGTEDQKQNWLRRTLTGELIWCLGFSEPDSGSDLSSARTRALATDAGFSITGQKIWTSHADKATHCFLLARTADGDVKHAGLTLLAVPMDQEGVTTRPIRQITGESEFFEVFFDGATTTDDAVIGEVGSGWTVVTSSLSMERGLNMFRRLAELNVMYQDLVEQCVLDAGDDRAALAAIAAHLGRARILLNVLRAQASGTAARLALDPAGPHPEDSADKLTLESAEQELLHAAMSLLGDRRGLDSPTPEGLDLARWNREYLYSRAASIYAGTTQIQKNILAKHRLKLPSHRGMS